MEKLVIEVELTSEELGLFDEFIEDGCIDQKKYMKKYVLRAIERHKHNKSVKEQMEKTGCYFS